jgi:hypothetical protein
MIGVRKLQPLQKFVSAMRQLDSTGAYPFTHRLVEPGMALKVECPIGRTSRFDLPATRSRCLPRLEPNTKHIYTLN